MAPAATFAAVGDRWAERCRGSHDARHPGALRAAQHRPQVVGVGDAVQDQQERHPAPLRRLAQVLERGVGDRPGQGHDPLGSVRSRRRVDPLARQVLDLHPPAGGEGLDVVQDFGGVHPLGHHQPVDGARPALSSSRTA